MSGYEPEDEVYEDIVVPYDPRHAFNQSPKHDTPEHYAALGMTPWDVFERGWLSREEFIGHLRASAIEYVARAPRKNGIDDYRKAIACLERLVAVLTK